MKIKTLIVVVALLAVLSLGAYFLRRPARPPSEDSRRGQSVAANAPFEKAARVRISDQGKAVSLSRQPDGSWHVSDYYDFPADFSKLTQLVGDLTEAKVSRLVSSRDDVISRLEFKDTKISLEDEAGKTLWSVTLGKTSDTGGRYLCFDEEKKAYLANLSLWLDAEPKNWADTQLINLKSEDIARVEFGFGEKDTPAVTIAREKKDAAWSASETPAGKRLKSERLTSLLGNFSNLRFTDTNPLDDANAVAAREHGRTIKLTTFDQKTYTVSLGRKPEEKKPKAPAPAAPTITKVSPDGTAASTTPPAVPTVTPEFETIPAGPVYISVVSSDEKAAINAMTQKRAFQVGELIYTGLPATAGDFWEDVPAETKKEESKEAPPTPPAVAP